MASQGPALQPGEVEGVINFVIDTAKHLQTRKFEIPLADLKPLLIGAQDEGHYLNRIRWKMRDQFRKANIKQRCLGDKYEFELDQSIEIDLAADREAKRAKRNANRQKTKTSTDWKEPYIAPPWFSDLLDVLEMGNRPILIGPKGCGKSRALEEAMSRMGLEVWRVALGEYRDIADLIGTKEIVERNGVPVTELVGGLLTEALKKGKGVILDEYDAIAPTMGAALNKIMEIGTTVVLPTEKGTVEFTPHENSRIAATSNTWGYGDDSGEFAGTFIQNRASWDRLRPKMPVNYDYKIERKLVSRYLPPKVVDALYTEEGNAPKHGIIIQIRRECADPKNPIDDTLGLRPILWFAQMWTTFGWHKGMFYLLQEFKEENREPIFKMITNRFGRGFAPSRNDFDKNQPFYIPDMMGDLINAGFGHLRS